MKPTGIPIGPYGHYDLPNRPILEKNALLKSIINVLMTIGDRLLPNMERGQLVTCLLVESINKYIIVYYNVE